jgi:hypothetical protein
LSASRSILDELCSAPGPKTLGELSLGGPPCVLQDNYVSIPRLQRHLSDVARVAATLSEIIGVVVVQVIHRPEAA